MPLELRPFRLAALCAALAGGFPQAAGANPYVEVASALDEGDPFDLHVSLDYEFLAKSASIKRELSGLPGTSADDPLPVVKDLVYSQFQHRLKPRLELGVFTDVSLSVALPIVLHDARQLEFDQRADPCVFGGGGGTPTCVNAENSPTVRDGLLPPTGFDADDPGGFTDPSDPTIFRGPDRSGLDQLELGAIWAPMNQDRDMTKPTWKIGAELRIAIGAPAKFDRQAPNSETGVGRGVTEVKLWTSMAKRISWALPYVEAWWIAPIATRSGAPLEKLDRSFGAERMDPMQRAATRFGFEAIAWENLADRQRVSIDLHTQFQAHFEGRDYSEMWEVFAFAGDAAAGGPLALDADPIAGGQQALSHPGVSNIENYLSVRGTLEVNAMLGERIRFGGAFSTHWDQSHIITFADAGIDLPTCAGGQTSGCESDSNEVVNPGTGEVNPLHVPAVDVAGRRYRVDEARSYIFGVHARALF